MNSDILNIKVNKTVRLNHNSNSSKMSLNGRLDVSPSLETKISDMQQKFRQVFMSHGQPLSYCNTIIKSINNNNFQKLQEEYKFKMYSFADEINSLKLGLSFSQQLKKIIVERQEVIRLLRLELISNRASKQINLATVCEKLDSIRLLTLIILEKIEGCRKKLQVLQSPYFTERLHKLGQDIDFLRISPLRKFIQFSNNQDPLFMVPLRKFWTLGSIASSQRRAIIDLFTINVQYKNRLEASDKFLRLMQKTDNRFENIDNQYGQLIDQLSSQFDSPMRQQKMNTLDKFTLPSVSRNNPMFEQNNRSQKTKQMISSMIKQVVSQYKSKTKESIVFQSPIRNNKKVLSRSIDKSKDVSDRETLNEKFHAKEKNNIKYITGRTASLQPANIQKNKVQIIKPNKLPQIDRPHRDNSDSRYLQFDQYLTKQIDQSLYQNKLNSNPLRVQDIEIKNHRRKICGKIRHNQLDSLRGMGRRNTQPTIHQNSPTVELKPKQQKLKTITDQHQSRNTYRTDIKNVGSRFSEKPRTNDSRSQNVSTPHLIGQKQYQKHNHQYKQDIQNIISRKQKQQEKRQYEISPQFNYSLSKQYNRHQGQFIVHKSISEQKLQRKDHQTSSNNIIPQKAQANKMRNQDSPSSKFKVSIPTQNSQIYPSSYRNNQSHYPSNSQENNKFQSKYEINRIQQDMQAENATSHRTANMSKNQISNEDDHHNTLNNTNIGKSNQPSLKQLAQKSNRTNGSPQDKHNLKETPINISIKKSQNSSGKSSSSQNKTVNQNPKINQQIQKKNNLDNFQNQEHLFKTSNQQLGNIQQQKKISSKQFSNEQGNNLTKTNNYEQKNDGIKSLNITKRQDQPINNKEVIFQKSSQEIIPQQSTNRSIQKIQKDSIFNQNSSNNPIYKDQVRNQNKQKNSFGNSNPIANKQEKQAQKKINYQNSSHNVQNKGKNGQSGYQTAQKNIIDSKANQAYTQKSKLSDSPQVIPQNNKIIMPISSNSNIQQKNNPQSTYIISNDSKNENLTNVFIPKQSNSNIINQQVSQKEQSKVSSSSSLEKTINTQKIGQMLKKCTFQSKMTKQKDLYVIIKTLSLNLQNQILEYICQPYFTYRHILMTACIFDNQYCGYCIYYPCIEPNQRTTYILHMQIVKQQFKQLQVALFNTFVRYIFTNDPCERIIYLKNNRLINKNAVKELKHYESEVKTSIPLIKTQETSYLLERKDTKCSKDEEYTSIISYVSLFISNKSDARFAVRNKQTLLGQGYLKRFQQMIKRPQTQKFSTSAKLNEYLSSQQLPEFKNIKYQSNIYLANQMIQDCILSSKFFVLAKEFYFTIQYPYTCLYEGQNAYFLAIASNVPDKYYIIADKLYEQSSIDLLQAIREELEGKSFDSLFKNPKYNGKVISCPSFGKHIELPVTEGYAIFEFGLFWKDYLKGLRYIQQDKLHLQVISPFLFGFIGIQSGRKIENLLCTIIDQKCLLK